MTHRIRLPFAAALLALAGTASSGEIDVMTQNQYLGTDLTPVITAPPGLGLWPSDHASVAAKLQY